MAGVGWDLAVGWPTAIVRDTRFGTPDWKRHSAWLWGSSPLAAQNPANCGLSGKCTYRVVPDNLADVSIDLLANPPRATVTLPSGLELTYAAVRYDGNRYPEAPPGAETDVFAFLLESAVDANRNRTCFTHKHYGDVSRGRVAALEQIDYGPAVKSCAVLPAASLRHTIKFAYDDAGSRGYYVPWSLRAGAPVSFPNLLTTIAVSALGTEQQEIELVYDTATATETRRPRLRKVRETALPGGDRNQAVSRTLRWFDYGARKLQYGTPYILDLGPDADFPASLAGAVSRPVRHSAWFGNPNGLFQIGSDQTESAAPPAHVTTEQWNLSDLDGDGLLDVLWANETGFSSGVWTYELPFPPNSARPSEQLVIRNEGVVGTTLATSRLSLSTSAPTFENAYAPSVPGASGRTPWIWAEGHGRMRTGMPLATTLPEIHQSVDCPPTALGDDTRRWPVLPDNTLGGSHGSIAERIDAAIKVSGDVYAESLNNLMLALNAAASIRAASVPREALSATLSGWLDIDGDSASEFISTPAFVQRFDLPAVCGGFAQTPEPPKRPDGTVDSNWQVAAMPWASSVANLAASSAAGPSGPWGLPLDYSISASTADGFGVTIPVTGAILAATSAIATNGYSLITDVPALATSVFVPRGAGGGLRSPAPSLSGLLLGLGSTVRSGSAAAAGTFLVSNFAPTLDLVILASTTRGRTHARGQLLDANADGLLDYIMYDSGGFVGGTAGDLLVFLNRGANGFAAPQALNRGFDYATRSDTQRITALLNDAQTNAIAAKAASVLCKAATDPVMKLVPCGALLVAVANASSTASATAAAVESFLNESPDALPEDRSRIAELRALATAEAVLAGLFTLNPAALPPDTAEVLNKAAQLSERAMRVTARTVRSLDHRSRLNAISKGFSELDGSLVGQSANGISAETAGLVDLNGDALPDYVVTRDREGACATDEWQVYWGTGASALAQGRGFSPAASCISIPAAPADIVARGYATLPMHVDMVRRAPANIIGDAIDTVAHAYVTLADFNQDGRPDLLIASSPWDPSATSRTWSVFLNNGSGFDLQPLSISSVQTALPNVQPGSPHALGLDVPYPAMRSAHTDASITLARDRSELHAGLLDIDGDGVVDVVRRIKHSPTTSGGTTTWRAGFLVWSRAGSAPQDLLIEERQPVDGKRYLVEYRPASYFQWPEGIPDGQPPKSGHTVAGGYLARSVTHEPLMGLPEQRTRLGYDYRSPYFDPVQRLPAAFAWRSIGHLHPTTDGPISESILSILLDPQRPELAGGATHAREVIRSTGVPITETITSYARTMLPTAGGGPGPTGAFFSAPGRVLRVEYPHDLTKAPVLDLGFDGREPLRNRVDPGMRSPAIPPGAMLDATSPSGGAISFSGTAGIVLPDPYLPVDAAQVTVEAWVHPEPTSGRGVIARHPDGYELAIDGGGHVSFAVNLAGSWGTPVTTSAPLPHDRWSHIAGSYDGQELRMFVNGVQSGILARPGSLTYPVSPGPLRIGCSWDPAANVDVDCFRGSLGELRIYPEAWRSAARITSTETAYELDPSQPNFGMPVSRMDYGDLAVPRDEVMEQLTYAVPHGGSAVRGAVATVARRALKSDGLTPGNYLGYAETRYDADVSGVPLPLGQVAAGNPTWESTYTGPSDVPTRPVPDSVSEKRYAQTGCPGLVTLLVDPLGAPTVTNYDNSCAFPISIQNALSHTARTEYYGVDGRPLADPVTRLRGLYGQVKSETSANGARTLLDYDVWGRVTATVGPHQPPERPAVITSYTDAQCKDTAGAAVPCDAASATRLAVPPLTTIRTWDDVRHDYRTAHQFGDGQVQSQVVRAGQVDDWLYSGTQDYDAFGRVITTYKPRYRPAACPPAGEWCYSEQLQGTTTDPLRDPAEVAHVQTAYDSRGRTVRTYGPDVPACTAPSAVDSAGNLLCDAIAAAATPSGHYTGFEYPLPGVVRTIDTRGVPSVVRLDAQDRTRRVEEYLRTSAVPYASSDYEVDPDGRTTAVRDGSGNTTFTTYDALGRKLFSVDPDMGTRKYQYDKRGNLLTQEDATGALIKNKYDTLGRLVRSEHWLPSTTRPGACVKPVAIGPPHLDPQGRLPYIPEIHWSPCQWVGPAEHPVPGTRVCSGNHPSLGRNSWRLGPQFANLRDLSPTTLQWDTVSLEPLPVVVGDPDSGLARFALPFDFALEPAGLFAPEDGALVADRAVPADRLIPAGTPVYVSTNGRLRLGRPHDLEAERHGVPNGPLPATDGAVMYAYWDDLVANELSTGVVGQAPERRLIVEWNAMPRSREGEAVFRAVLFEATHEVQYQYQTLPAGSATARIGLHRGPGEQAVEFRSGRGRIKSGQALTTLRRIGRNPVQFGGDAVDGDSVLYGQFAFRADLREETEARLSFKHSWSTRCAGYPKATCPVDDMSVMAAVAGEPTLYPLLSPAELVFDQAFEAGRYAMDGAPTMSVALPDALLGKEAIVFFSFAGKDRPDLTGPGWTVDDVRVCGGKAVREIEDVIEWRYDSAEPSFEYESSQPVLDLTFDVPGDVVDRTPLGTEERTKRITGRIKTTGIGSGNGVSGQALRLDGVTTRLEVDAARLAASPVSPFTQTLTGEAWVNPTAFGNSGDRWLLGKRGTFSIRRDGAGHLVCTAEAGGSSAATVSTGTVPVDTWTHIALTYDGSELWCTINGVADGSASLSGTPGWTDAPLTLGAELSGGVGFAFFSGLMDEVRVFATARTPAEILADVQAPHRHGPPRGNVLDLGFADPQDWGADASGANNPAQQVNADLVPGVQGTSVRFDGTPARYVMVPSSPSLAFDELTAETWMKAESPVIQDRLLVGKWNGAALGWRLAIDDLPGQPGHVRFEVRTRVFGPNTWSAWTGDTRALPAQANGSCGLGGAASTDKRLWIAPSTGPFRFTTIGSASWNTVLFVLDDARSEVACNDDFAGTAQSTVQINAVQGRSYMVFVSGSNAESGPFAVNVVGLGPDKTNTSFTTRETVNDGIWHHVAGTYDGHILRVYIDGKPAHRLCRRPPTDPENPVEGDEIPCERPGITERPPPDCAVEWDVLDNAAYPTGVCVTGSVSDTLPVYIANYDPAFFPSHASLEGLQDEVRVSNYAKRDFEVAGSARLYSHYTGALGLVTEMRNRAATDSYSYDLLGHETSVHKRTRLAQRGVPPEHTGSYLSRSARDNLGRATSLRYPDGEVAVSDYSLDGTQVRLTGNGPFGRQPYLTGSETTSTGRLAELRFGNGVRTTFAYDEGPTRNPTTGAANANGTFGNELLSRQVTRLPNGQLLQDQTYQYDAGGNLLNRTDLPTSVHGAGYAGTYTYDDLSRLRTFETRFGGTVVASGSYDPNPLGNLERKDGAILEYGVPAGSQRCGRTQNSSLPHAVTRRTPASGAVTEYCYDANGRLSEVQAAGAASSRLRHNVAGKLSEFTRGVDKFVFAYDGNGDRVYHAGPAGLTAEPFAFYRETPAIEKYYFLGDRRIARRVGVDLFWYHPEHLGGINLMTDLAAVERQDAYAEYMPFGSPLPTAVNNQGYNTPDHAVNTSGGFQFTGKELDDTKLYYYGARYYDPEIGRFIEPDIITPDITPSALNRYSYALNNPLRYIDPTGLSSETGASLANYGGIDRFHLLTEADYLAAEVRSAIDRTLERCGVTGCREAAYYLPPPYRGPTISAAKAPGVIDPLQGVFSEQQRDLLYGSIRVPLLASVAGSYIATGVGGAVLVGSAGLDVGTALGERDYLMAAVAAAGGVFDIAALSLRPGVTAPFRGRPVSNPFADLTGSEIDSALSNLASKYTYRTPVSVTEAGIPLESLVPTSRWGRSGLQPGDWLMYGPPSKANYVLSFKWDPNPTNIRASFGVGKGYMLPPQHVRWPQGWGFEGWWKGLFGQRKYAPQAK